MMHRDGDVAIYRNLSAIYNPVPAALTHCCSYNITLAAGHHALAVILANGMYNVRGDGRYTKFSNSGAFGPRTLWLSVDLALPDGRFAPAAIVSDAQWLCDASGGPLTFSHVCAAPFPHSIFVTNRAGTAARTGMRRRKKQGGTGLSSMRRLHGSQCRRGRARAAISWLLRL
jgi:hypothetical protein